VSSYPIERIAGYLARQIALGVVALPFALLGTLIHLVPYLLIHGIARRVRHEPNQVATYKVFPGIVLYPFTWAIFSFAAWRYGGWPAGAAMFLLAPLVGGIAIRYLERLERFGREARAFLLLKGRRGLAEEVRARRRVVTERIDALVEFWTEAQAFDPASRSF
jgi:hypothetical protein